MYTPEKKHNLLADIAKAADICMKPFIHAVLNNEDSNSDLNNHDLGDLILRIECRDSDGIRTPENDLDLEVYRSGNDISIMISKVDSNQKSILWQGKHSVWMNGDTGISCDCPKDGSFLESFARRLRTILVDSEE